MNVQAHSFGSSLAENKEGRLWRHIKMNSMERDMYRSIIMTEREELPESQERFQDQKRSYGVGTSFPHERSG